MNWTRIYNMLFEIINREGDTYYSGPKFMNTINNINSNVPSYMNYIEQRRTENKSTSRRDYYYDLLMEQSENERIQIVSSILNAVGDIIPKKTAVVRELLAAGNQLQSQQVQIPNDLFNADKLVKYIDQMDTEINKGNYEHTLTLGYTCLECFYKSFIREKIPAQTSLNELTPMAVEIRKYIKNKLDTNKVKHPEQVIVLISTVTNAIANARNNFSDSHSGSSAEKWVAIYIRDNVNSIVKMLLNFI